MGRLWPFDDYQPVGFIDLVFSGGCLGMVLWPPFFGLIQGAACLAEVPHPATAPLVVGMIALLVLTGAAIGVLSSLAIAVGGYYRKPWVRRAGPFIASAALVGAESWWLPHLFAGSPAVWRPGSSRVIGGAAASIPGAWAAVQVAYRCSRVWRA